MAVVLTVLLAGGQSPESISLLHFLTHTHGLTDGVEEA